MIMQTEHSEKSRVLLDKLSTFMDEHIYPNEDAYAARKPVCTFAADG